MATAEVLDGSMARAGDPCVMVIFGAAGDLTKRKLIPALYNLHAGKCLPRNFAVVGLANTDMSTDDFRKRLGQELPEFAAGKVDPELWKWLSDRLYYIPGDFGDREAYSKLKQTLQEVETNHGTSGNCIFYLATAPAFFGEIVRHLGASGLAAEEGDRWRRVIIEKPFGHDLDSARVLNQEVKNVLKERQIYRIDHYLGKETVQNMLVFRFGNGIFEPIWNRRYIDHIQITVAETVGLEQRGAYYEEAGALRDMVPNHILQLVALTAMEPPISFDPEAVRDEKAKVLHAIQPLKPEEVLTRAVRGQYGEGSIGAQRLAGYRSEPRVSPTSLTETYVALELFIDNWRWAEVPFYLRTGKRLARRVTEVAIQFKRVPTLLFRKTAAAQHLMANTLVARIQPDEGISLSFCAKVPGPSVNLGQVDMAFKYSEYFGNAPSTGYETLLLDCMIGDATLFQRDDMVEAGWSIVTPILDVWKALPARNFPNYSSGSCGPREADEMMERDGRKWRKIG